MKIPEDYLRVCKDCGSLIGFTDCDERGEHAICPVEDF